MSDNLAIGSINLTEKQIVPFTKEMFLSRLEGIAHLFGQLEEIRSLLQQCKVREVRDAYVRVYNDIKWKTIMKIQDVWIWAVQSEDYKEYISNQNER